jgi:hypothetical protein
MLDATEISETLNPTCNNPGRFKLRTPQTRELEVEISYLS